MRTTNTGATSTHSKKRPLTFSPLRRPVGIPPLRELWPVARLDRSGLPRAVYP